MKGTQAPLNIVASRQPNRALFIPNQGVGIVQATPAPGLMHFLVARAVG